MPATAEEVREAQEKFDQLNPTEQALLLALVTAMHDGLTIERFEQWWIDNAGGPFLDKCHDEELIEQCTAWLRCTVWLQEVLA